MIDLSQTIPKGFSTGTHRTRSPAETFASVSRFLPVMGITRVANVTGLDDVGIPVVMVCRPNSRSVAVSQGKGLTLAAAKTSGLMESVEGYHAETITLPLKLASYEELRYTHRVVDVTRLPLIRETRFHFNKRILWIEGQDLIGGESVWVPYEMVHTDYTLPPITGESCFPLTSNGLASGNHQLEAVAHGINEVVERDATTLWGFLPTEAQRATRIDPATVDDPSCRLVLDQLARAEIDALIWDITSDVGLPSFQCLIFQQGDQRLRGLYGMLGMGTHTNREIALLRALTEAVQSRLTLIAGSRDDIGREHYQHGHQLEIIRRIREEAHAFPPERSFQSVPTFPHPTFNEDIRCQIEHLQAVGIDSVIAVDLTKPELRIPVVRMIIPGLELIGELDDYFPGRRAQALLHKLKQNT